MQRMCALAGPENRAEPAIAAPSRHPRIAARRFVRLRVSDVHVAVSKRHLHNIFTFVRIGDGRFNSGGEH